mgnify:CR=1 FL=1
MLTLNQIKDMMKDRVSIYNSMLLSSKLKNIAYIFNDHIQYVSDAIGTDWLYKWTPNVPVIISAQTGHGKNFFIQNTIVPKILKHNRQNNDNQQILILSNRIALNHQNKIELAKIIDKYSNYNYSYENKLNKLTDEQLNDFFDFGSIKISSYQQLLSNNLLNNDYAFVIIDECHFFTQDSLFNADTSKILDDIINKCKNSIRIYMSATLDDILPVILKKDTPKYFRYSPYEIKSEFTYNSYYQKILSTNFIPKETLPFFYKVNKQSIQFKQDLEFTYAVFYDNQNEEVYPYSSQNAIIYYLESNYDYIKINQLPYDRNALIEKISTNHSQKSKWIIFVKTKKEGISLKENLSKKDISVEFISSESKNLSNTAYQQIIKKCKFDVEVLISTAVIDNGVNIKDKDIKNIAISVFDYTSFIQMLGRIRPDKGQKINLYLFDFPIKKIEQDINKNYNDLIEYLYFDTLSSNKQFEYYQNRLLFGAGKGGFNCNSITREPYHSEAVIDKLLNTIYNLTPFIKNLDSNFKLEVSNPRQKYTLINNLEDISSKNSQKELSLFYKKCLLVLKDDISPKKRELYIEPSLITDEYIKKIFYYIYGYEPEKKFLNLYDILTVRQYFYLNKIRFFMDNIITLNNHLNKLYTNLFLENKNKINEIKTRKKDLESKIEKYVKLFNHNDLSFDYKDIPCSPIIYHQLLWLEKFELDFVESENNQSLTNKKLIEELNQLAISKQEYNETKTNNADKNNLLMNKGFLSSDKDNEPIYQKIQELITNIKGKGDFKSTKKINSFFSEQNIPFEIISEQTTTDKQTYWLILKSE